MKQYTFYRRVNKNKFQCECGYRTHNKSNYKRHQDTARCWIQRNHKILPAEICKLIQTFLIHKPVCPCTVCAFRAFGLVRNI